MSNNKKEIVRTIESPELKLLIAIHPEYKEYIQLKKKRHRLFIDETRIHTIIGGQYLNLLRMQEMKGPDFLIDEFKRNLERRVSMANEIHQSINEIDDRMYDIERLLGIENHTEVELSKFLKNKKKQ